jgi:hypothetical protein
MRIPLCRFHPFNRVRFHLLRKTKPGRGQVIVIFAVTLLAMIFFAGLAIDAGSLYVTYSQLRRAIDAAAVAAANDYKAEGLDPNFADFRPRMRKAAMEVMKLHGLNETDMDLKLYVCDDGSAAPADFIILCPVAPDSPRKLVRIDATLKAPLYFLFLLGFQAVPLESHSVAEAAPIDLVIVIDTSESMANETWDYPTDGSSYDPWTCNHATYDPATDPTDLRCLPLGNAKDAAKELIKTLYDGYDHVAVVNFDVVAPATDTVPMREDLQDAIDDVEALNVRNDPPIEKIRYKWYPFTKDIYGDATKENFVMGFNPVHLEDQSGDGNEDDSVVFQSNPDPSCKKGTLDVANWNSLTDMNDRWDSSKSTAGWDGGGIPCDVDNKIESYDMNGDGIYTDQDDLDIRAYLEDGTKTYPYAPCSDASTNPPTCPMPYYYYLTPNSTCTGCGIRVGAQVLKNEGRSNSVWVMVFLSDGLVNLSDTHDSDPTFVTSQFPLGFCTGGLGSFMWGNDCVDNRKDDTVSPRYCLLDTSSATCPPGSTYVAGGDTTLYTPYDYALDMVDYAALTDSENAAEVAGEPGTKIAIYSIGLGGAGDVPAGASGPIGEYLLRYAASVGDDGSRKDDPCDGVATQTKCGQYYYTSTGAGLSEIFNDISSRIYSRLTQ